MVVEDADADVGVDVADGAAVDGAVASEPCDEPTARRAATGWLRFVGAVLPPPPKTITATGTTTAATARALLATTVLERGRRLLDRTPQMMPRRPPQFPVAAYPVADCPDIWVASVCDAGGPPARVTGVPVTWRRPFVRRGQYGTPSRTLTDRRAGPKRAPVERGRPASTEEAGSTSPGAQRPRFSVVLPALNEELCLPGCLSSLAGQDFDGEVEVIVVDNNSTDQTAAVARSHGAVVVHEPRPGVCWARQRGTEVARGDVIVSTDADTTFDPSWLTRIDRSLREHPSCVAVGGPCAFTVDSPLWARVYPRALFGAVAFVHRLTGRVFYVTATNLAFRREAWPGYDTQMTQGGDEVDLLRRLSRRGPVHFDRRNPTFTSARRLERGLAYNLVVTFFVYYLLAYWLNRIAGRPLIGTAPAFRRRYRTSSPVQWARRLVLASTVCLLGALLFRTGVYVAGLVW